MGFLAPIVSVISGIAGIASAVKSFTSKPSSKAPKQVALPPAPKPEDAAAQAEADVKKRRRAVTKTNLTKGSALVPETNIERPRLLGD